MTYNNLCEITINKQITISLCRSYNNINKVDMIYDGLSRSKDSRWSMSTDRGNTLQILQFYIYSENPTSLFRKKWILLSAQNIIPLSINWKSFESNT